MALRGLSQISKFLPEIERAVALLTKREGDIVVTGIGKSGAIAEKIAATLTSLGARAIYLHPVDAIHGDIGALSTGDVMLALSFSGESKEIVRIAHYAKKEFGVPIVALTRLGKSSLGKLADAVVPVPVKEEGSPGGMAPMASTTTMLVLGDMIAAALVEMTYKRDDFARFHPGGGLGLELKKVKTLAKTGSALPKIDDNASVRKALKEMSRKTLGVTAVLNGKGKLTGVVTDGDIRRWLIKGGNPDTDTVKKVMTKNPKTVFEEATLKEALRMMEDYRITTLFMIDKRKALKGIIHIHDIVEENIV